MIEKIDEFLNRLVGQIVWSVRRGYGTYLTMQFGCPHLVIREPIVSTSESARVVKALARRRVMIFGDFSLSIRDSKWSISTKEGKADLDTSEAIVLDVLRSLDGQKIYAVRRADDTVLEFDLGATLRLGKSIFAAEKASVLWTLHGRYGDPSISLLNDGSILSNDSDVRSIDSQAQ